MRADRSLLAGLFLICLANMLLEIVITRLFSATMFYHFTFLAVALALFGVAASGVYLFVTGEHFAGDLRADMAKAARRFAAGTLLAVVYALVNPIEIAIVTGSNTIPQFTSRQALQLVLLVGFTAIPFFYAGLVVSLALTYLTQDTNRVYAWDLAGAAAAALLVSPLLFLVGGPNSVLVAVALGLAGAALFEGKGLARWVWLSVGVGAVLCNLAVPIIRVPTTKGVKLDALRFERWNAYSRVTVDDKRTIKIDASAATHIEDLRSLKPGIQAREISALGYAVFAVPPKSALVIGPGGGRDVLHALAAGVSQIVGIEVNPIIAETIMKQRFREASGGLYFDSRVTVVVDDGRSFVRRSKEKYDIVQASLVDTWAATAAGAFALTENALYTVEAFEDYLDHITDRGIVTVTRWHTGAGGETARLLILAAAALERRGIPTGQARKHMLYAVSRRAGLGTMILKRTLIEPEEFSRVMAICAASGFDIEVSPTSPADHPLARYLDEGSYGERVERASQDLRPPTDDRPFFFYFKKARDLLKPTGLMNDPGLWILISLGSVVALTVAFVIGPLVFDWRRRDIGPSRSGSAGLLLYFGLVGFAFMVLEIALLQRFTLFLGHPSYSLVVILFSVLLSTSAGAYLSSRFAILALDRVLWMAGAGLALCSVIGGFVLPAILHALMGAPLPARALLTILLVAPSGVLMGVMIPSIVRILGATGSPLVPWGWGVNGATSVLGTVIATVIAIYGGFTVTFVVGAIAYLCAGVLGARIARRVAPRTPRTRKVASPRLPS